MYSSSLLENNGASGGIICNICDEKVKNNKINKFITCPYCEFEACRKCCERYILGEPVEKCMNTTACGKPWTRSFLTDAFPKSFVYGSLKEHKKNLLFERERSMLPATQPLVEEVLRKERICDLMKANHRNEIDATKELRNARAEIVNDILDIEELIQRVSEDAELRIKRFIMIEKQKRIEKELNKIQEKYYSIERSLRIELGRDKKETVIKTFIRACPDGECRGFLSSQWKCGICDKSTCSQCHVVKQDGEEHTCDPDNVATATLISSDTKPCPKCQTGIFKIEGCDQMFCTQCHTGFSWKTGHIQTRIHNPHYFEWMRRRTTVADVAAAAIERNPLDMLCGREIDTGFVVQLMRLMDSNITLVDDIAVVTRKYPERLRFQAVNMARLMIHMREVEIPKFAVDDVIDNQDLRVQYLLGKMDETAFKVELYRRFKKQDYKREHRDVLIMFRNTVTDILYRIMDEAKLTHRRKPCPHNLLGPGVTIFSHSLNSQNVTEVTCQTMMEEIESLIGYVNECLVTMTKTFGSVPRIMKFTENYETMTIHYGYKGKK